MSILQKNFLQLIINGSVDVMSTWMKLTDYAQISFVCIFLQKFEHSNVFVYAIMCMYDVWRILTDTNNLMTSQKQYGLE